MWGFKHDFMYFIEKLKKLSINLIPVQTFELVNAHAAFLSYRKTKSKVIYVGGQINKLLFSLIFSLGPKDNVIQKKHTYFNVNQPATIEEKRKMRIYSHNLFLSIEKLWFLSTCSTSIIVAAPRIGEWPIDMRQMGSTNFKEPT